MAQKISNFDFDLLKRSGLYDKFLTSQINTAREQAKEIRNASKYSYDDRGYYTSYLSIHSRLVLPDLKGLKLGGSFDASDRNLITLKGSPSIIKGNFIANDNLLINLEHSPYYVTGNYWVRGNKLRTLEGCTQKIGKDFWVQNNLLTTLEGGPKSVGGQYYCRYNRLKNLVGMAQEVGSIDCSNNKEESDD